MSSAELALRIGRAGRCMCHRRNTQYNKRYPYPTFLARLASTVAQPPEEAADGQSSLVPADRAPVLTEALLQRARVVPASPSYFSAKPKFTDSLIALQALLRKHELLPTLSTSEAPRMAWKTATQFKVSVNEPVKNAKYARLVSILKRLSRIHPALMPLEVSEMLQKFRKEDYSVLNRPNPVVVDELGRAKGVGRRKTSWAYVWVVDGEGEVLVNDRPLTQMFGRIHDRESVIWPLKATQRVDKYNVWAIVKGGGVTGQAEALTLAIAKALLVHEPALKPALRRGKRPPCIET